MTFSIILLLILGWIVFTAIQNSRSTSTHITPDNLDLDSVRNAIMEKQGWDADRASSAQSEYLRFLTLLQLKPGFMLVPWPTPDGHDDLDQFWHQHILDTAKYQADCHRLFGRIIHHNPHVLRGSGKETDAVEKTQRLYAQTFNSGPYGQAPDVLLLSSCSTCGTADTHHSTHGDASHSDSGHSCGGHGCGHGCGGH